MSTNVGDIADAVLSQVQSALAGNQGLTFAGQRAYLPAFDLKNLSTMQIIVVPRAVAIEAIARNESQYDYGVDIGVYKKLATMAPSEIDPIMGVVEQLAATFDRKQLPAYPAATCIKVEYSHLYSWEQMDQLRQFTAVMTLTFRVIQ